MTGRTSKSRITAIMQPYFLPYLGYFQLIAAADLFIVYDNIKYTKKGWINRNRILNNGTYALISVPLKADSDRLDIRDRQLASDFGAEKLLNQLNGAYRKAPYFHQAFPVLESILRRKEKNLFRFIYQSILSICEYVGISTAIRISSSIPIDHSLKNQDKVLALCKAVDTDVYLNAIGGVGLYSKKDFDAQRIELQFIRTKPFEYRQFGQDFVPSLSIADVLMFNPLDAIRDAVYSNYELIEGI